MLDFIKALLEIRGILEHYQKWSVVCLFTCLLGILG